MAVTMNPENHQNGYIHLYTGNGKGKTTRNASLFFGPKKGKKIRDVDSPLSRECQQSLYRRIRQALRYGILLGLTGKSFCVFLLRVADSASVKLFSDEEITQLIHELNRALANKKEAEKLCCIGRRLCTSMKYLQIPPE